MRPISRSLWVALALLAGSSPAGYCTETPRPGDFPNKPIRWIIPFPPGGSNDMLSRFLGAKLTDRMGQQMVIDNRGGEAGRNTSAVIDRRASQLSMNLPD